MRIYLDNSATTHTDPEVFEAMKPYFCEVYGNGSSQHFFGREALAAIDRAREQVAAAIGCKPSEVYFTSGGTESDNWAIKGTAHALAKKGRHIITTKIEHPAVIKTCEALEREGFEVTYLDVDGEGFVTPEAVEAAIRPDTVLISVMTANNEIGTIEPIREIGAVAKAHKVLFHTDAVQAVGNVDIDVVRDNIDMLSMSAHKFYGPKGVGVLYKRNGVKIERFMDGGEQERNMRASTLNTPGIVGLGRSSRSRTWSATTRTSAHCATTLSARSRSAYRKSGSTARATSPRGCPATPTSALNISRASRYSCVSTLQASRCRAVRRVRAVRSRRVRAVRSSPAMSCCR